MVIKINYTSSDIYVSTNVSPVYVVVNYSAVNNGGSGAVWGGIVGTLSDQTDLQTALDGKVPYTGATANVNLGEFGLATGQVTLDTTPTGTAVVGTTRWNDTAGITETTLKGGNVILKNGVDLVARVVNKVTPNATLTKATYQAVRISGAQGQRLAVALAQANNDTNSADTIGLVTETIATNQEGFIMTMGQLENINTTGSLQGETWVDGDVLYLSPTTAGAITKVKPTGAGHIVVIGYVEYSHANNGKIYVKVMNGWELDELHDVSIVSPLNDQVLTYESATSLWKNKAVSNANIYTADGTLTADRTITSGGNSLTILGGKVTTGGSTSLTLQTSATNIGNLNFELNNTFTTTGKNWQLRSFGNGNFDIANRTDGVVNLTCFPNGRVALGSTATQIANANVSLSGVVATSGAIQVQGTIAGTSATGNGIEIDWFGDTAYFTSYGRTSGLWYPIIIRGSQIDLQTPGGTTRARITAAGRLLLGTTTEGTFLLDVNGTARVSGLLTVTGSTTAASAIARGANFTPTLVAAANNDVLVGLDINPTFTNGAFTGVRNAGARVRTDNFNFVAEAVTTGAFYTGFNVRNTIGKSGILMIGSSGDVSGHASATVVASIDGNLNLCAGFDAANGGAYFMRFATGGYSMPTSEKMRLTAAGRLLINRTTESFYVLDVQGASRVTGNLGVEGTGVVTFGIGNTAISTNWYFENYRNAVAGSLEFSNSISDPFITYFSSRSLAIGSYTETTSALLAMTSTTKGFLPPRLSTTQKNAIATPAAGLQVYDTTLNQMSYYNGTTWVNF